VAKLVYYEIVHDPMKCENGGFEVGAKFLKEEVMYMLKYFSFSEHTIIRHRKRLYRVETRKSHHKNEPNTYRHYLVDDNTGEPVLNGCRLV
jgi:hypothetical protein